MKLLILSVFPAPYRVDVFRELGKHHSIDLFFERTSDENRSASWFVKDSDITIRVLDNSADQAQYAMALKNLRKYDLVMAYDYSTPTALKLILRCMAFRVPYALNADGAFISRHFVKSMIKRFFIQPADICFAGSEHASDYFRHHGARKARIFRHCFSSLHDQDILPGPVTADQKRALRNELGLPDRPIVLSVGQFIYRKGFDSLLRAWQDVRSDSQLLIIGGGELEGEYSNYVQEHRLDRVSFMPFMPKKELFRYYQAADLFVLPTREDIWGLVVGEAMACGLPVISTDRCIAGLELIDTGVNGYLVPVDDAAEMARRIDQALSDRLQLHEMGGRNLERIRPYTIESIVASHLTVLDGWSR